MLRVGVTTTPIIAMLSEGRWLWSICHSDRRNPYECTPALRLYTDRIAFNDILIRCHTLAPGLKASSVATMCRVWSIHLSVPNDLPKARVQTFATVVASKRGIIMRSRSAKRSHLNAPCILYGLASAPGKASHRHWRELCGERTDQSYISSDIAQPFAERTACGRVLGTDGFGMSELLAQECAT